MKFVFHAGKTTFTVDEPLYELTLLKVIALLTLDAVPAEVAVSAEVAVPAVPAEVA